ncbi:MAG TPA: OB-fold nucleic acid binding domain-containing protein, partial [bacterium]
RMKRQTSIFDLAGGDDNGAPSYPMLPMVSPWTDSETLSSEKEMLGFYVSGHPLDKYAREVRTFATVTLDVIGDKPDGTPVKICGIITESKTIFDRKGKPMAFATIEDFHGSVEVITFASVYENVKDSLVADKMVLLEGRVNRRDEEDSAKVLCEGIVPLEKAWKEHGKSLHLSMNVVGVDDPLLNEVSEILKQNPGNCSLFIDLNISEQESKTIKSKKMKVKPSADMIVQLRDLLGQENVWMEG